MNLACAQHPEVPALYECDGCGRNLCPECTVVGHALVFCKVCGERALPLEGAAVRAGASPREVKRLAAQRKPYSIGQALAYPFRGFGKFLFLIALLCQGGVEVMLRFGFGFYRYFLALGFWSLLIGLQFKIARTTAEGQDELPDWPDYFSWGERFFDMLVYLILMLWQVAPAAIFAFVFRSAIFSPGPNFLFWIGFAVLCWVGIAAGAMALGSVGKFMPDNVLRIDLHIRAFRACGAEAVTFTNILFGLGAAVWLVRLDLASVPIAGAALSGILGIHWLFVSAHLAGLIFRRHGEVLGEIYE